MNLLSGAEIQCPLSVLERVHIIEGFFQKKIYENFVGTLETVHNIEVSILERCQYREVRLYWTTSLKYIMQSINKDKSLHLAVNKLSIRPISGRVIVIRDQSSPTSLAQSTAQLLTIKSFSGSFLTAWNFITVQSNH